jgi:hypothetical protein
MLSEKLEANYRPKAIFLQLPAAHITTGIPRAGS